MAAIFLSAFASQSVLAHSYSLRRDQSSWLLQIEPNKAYRSWLWQIEPSKDHKLLLTTAVQATCQPEIAGHTNLLGVSYIRLNSYSLNFYSEKELYSKGYRCYYRGFGPTEQNVQRVLANIAEIAPPYILTVLLEKQPPPDFVNIVSKSVAEFVAMDARYTLKSGPGDYLLVYRKVR